MSDGEAERTPVSTVTLHVPGMSCRHRVRVVTARLRDLAGVDTVVANVDTAMLVIDGSVTEARVRAVLTEVGFPAADHPR
jgi:copper chaperone CopZ